MNDVYKPIESFETNWQEVGQESNFLSVIFDGMFGWVNDSIEGRYTSLDQQRSKMLQENPDLDISALDDGFALEAEKLNAIRQKQSRGFTIIDINPGLLTEQEAVCNLPYEFLFDGTGFMPNQTGSVAKNFRTVPLDISGNFLKIEYIYENNQRSNILSGSVLPPKTNIKYVESLETVDGEFDLKTGQTESSFDQFARNKIFVGFGDNIQKPHIVTRSGDYFNTYFNSLSLTFNIGCPKIRITIGFNSEKHDGPNVAAVNSNLEMTGAGRMFSDLDSVMTPFCLTEYDNGTSGKYYLTQSIGTTLVQPLIQNTGYNYNSSTDYNQRSLGYSLIYINRIRFHAQKGSDAIPTYMRVNIYLSNFLIPPIIGPAIQTKRVHSFTLFLSDRGPNLDYGVYQLEMKNAIRVIIPNGNLLLMETAITGGAGVVGYDFSIDGYAYGELLRLTSAEAPFVRSVYTSKYITDSSFISDYNRINSLEGP